MRVLAALAVVLLAGCFAPPEERDDDPLIGLCPQWVEGEAADISGATNGTWNRTFEPNGTLDGHPFDGLVLRFSSVAGTVTVTVWDPEGDHAAILYDYRRAAGDEVQSQARLTEADDQTTLRATLHAVNRPADGGPIELRLRATGEASWQAEATTLYRVCQAP